MFWRKPYQMIIDQLYQVIKCHTLDEATKAIAAVDTSASIVSSKASRTLRKSFCRVSTAAALSFRARSIS